MCRPEFSISSVYKSLSTTDARIIHICGGRGRGGSHAITQHFLLKLITAKYFRGYFMRSTFGAVRLSLWKDLKDRIEEMGLPLSLFRFNENEMSVRYLPTGNEIFSKGFRASSGKQTANLKSIAGATDIAIEECEEIERKEFNKLNDSVRTTKAGLHIYKIFNMPHKSHWLITDYYDLEPIEHEGFFRATPKEKQGFLSIFSTYKDNLQNIDATTAINFESYSTTDPDHYLTDICGYVSSGAKGKIFKQWSLYDDTTAPDFTGMYRLYGLDFGWSNDPSALSELTIDRARKQVYIKECFYATEMQTPEIITGIKKHNTEKDEVVCDHELREIHDLFSSGINAFKADKRNKKSRIGILKSYEIFIHKDSKNLRFEFENYTWALDPMGEPLNKPVDKDDHLIDAALYAITYYNNYYKY